MVVSLAVLYNVIFVLGRAVFWELNNATRLWLILDYVCDFIYVLDTLVHAHEGKNFFFTNLIICLLYVATNLHIVIYILNSFELLLYLKEIS